MTFDLAIYIIGFDGESFESARASMVWSEPAPLQYSIDYGEDYLKKGFVDSVQIYNEQGDLVHEMKKERMVA